MAAVLTLAALSVFVAARAGAQPGPAGISTTAAQTVPTVASVAPTTASDALDCAARAPVEAAVAGRALNRAVGNGHLELPLARPLGSGDHLCLWSADAQAPAVRVLKAQPCASAASHCARVALPAEREARVFDVWLGAGWVRLTVPPAKSPLSPSGLYFVVLAGLLLSVLLTTWLAQQGRAWRLRRAWSGLDARLRQSAEDHPEIRLRLQATLSFVKHMMFRAGIFGFRDLDLADERLREADQLLRLSERKTLLWTRADARPLPPSGLRRFYEELRLFDREILQLPLPLESSAFLSAVPESLGRAEKLLAESSVGWDADNLALLRELSRPDAANAITTFPPLGPHQAVAPLLAEQLDLELARLALLCPQGAPAVAPADRAEADLRLDLVRCIAEACRSLMRAREADQSLPAPTNDEPSLGGARHHRDHFARPETVRQLRRALRTWRSVDLTRQTAQEVHRELVRLLRWAPENAAVRAWLTEPTPPRLAFSERRRQWRTFTPERLSVEVRDPERSELADDFYWRQRIEVAWGCTTPGKRVFFGGRPLQPVTDAPHQGLPPGNRAGQSGHGWYVSRGPQNLAFVAEQGTLAIEAWVRASAEGDDPAGPWQPVGQFELNVDASVDAHQATQTVRANYARMLLSALAIGLLAPTIVTQAAEEPNAVLSVLLALLLPLGVDQGSLTATQGLKGVAAFLGRLRAGGQPPA